MAVISVPNLRIQINTDIVVNNNNEIDAVKLNSALINTVDSLEAAYLGKAGGTMTGDITMAEDTFIKGPIAASAKLNLTANIFNDSGIPTISFNGATNTPATSLTGFVYKAQFDWTGLIMVGDKLQVIDTQGNVNDGVHVLTGIEFNGADTEFQWAAMTPDTNSPYGDWARSGDGSEWVLGTENSRITDYALSFGITTDRERLALLNNHADGIIQIGDFFKGSIAVSIDNVDMTLIGGGFTRFGSIRMADNLSGDIPYVDIPSFPANIASQDPLVKQNIYNSVSLGGEDIIIKTNDSAYVNKLAFNAGEAFETVLDYITATQDNTITFPNADMNFETAITEALTFGGGGSGDVATMTFTNGIITSRTLVP